MRLRDLEMALALEGTAAGTHMAAAMVDPDGTARIELLERRADGWHNLTTDRAMTSAEMALAYDDVVLTRLPDGGTS